MATNEVDLGLSVSGLQYDAVGAVDEAVVVAVVVEAAVFVFFAVHNNVAGVAVPVFVFVAAAVGCVVAAAAAAAAVGCVVAVAVVVPDAAAVVCDAVAAAVFDPDSLSFQPAQLKEAVSPSPQMERYHPRPGKWAEASCFLSEVLEN